MKCGLICPVCGREDAIAAKDEPRFYRDGRLTAVCFHGHDGRGRVVFDAESGALLQHVELQPHELLYRAAEAEGARGFGAAFLAEHCGVYVCSRKAIQQVQPLLPTEKDWIRAESQSAALTLAPQYLGAEFVGLEVRQIERASGAPCTKWTKMLGARGLYIANPRLQPSTVVIFEGTWDAIAAAWDAFNAGEPHRYAFCSIPAGFGAADLERTLQAHFPGVPALLVTDQDPSGKSARTRLARVATPAILPGCGLAKDYREADPAKRWDALLEAIEHALSVPAPGEEHGLAKIARRALEGALRAKGQGMRDLEAWRFGQRCAGICAHPRGGRRYFGIRARINDQMPVAEGLHEFTALLGHRLMRKLREDYPDLAATVEGGPTETHMSPAWLPPQFLEDGRHWTEIPQAQRAGYARERGWEPWTGKDPGAPTPADLDATVERLRRAYLHVRIPGVPDSEVGERVAAFCLATALSALWAEERWQAGEPCGFLPITWFFGGAATGKGTAAKICALLVAGEPRTYGSQRFDGGEGGWLTESVLHLPICFRDELDQFLSAAYLEDLKTYASGEPLQLRKKFGSDMTIAPKPVVFSSNALKINEDDEATKDRVNLVQLEPSPISTKAQRNAAFDAFYTWLDAGGRQVVHRAGILLYRDFRGLPIPPARWTRSQVFDAALDFASARLHLNPDEVIAAAQAAKDLAIRQGLPWFQSLQDYVRHDLAEQASYHEARVAQVFACSPDETGTRKLRRWLDQLERAMGVPGRLRLGTWDISMGPRTSSTNRMLHFHPVFEEASHDHEA
jgi:hypothetical protein